MAASTAPSRGLRVLVSGASGMVGRALCAELSTPSAANAFQPQVLRLVRRQPRDDSEVYWDPYEMRIDLKKCEGVDAVVHLAGACLFSLCVYGCPPKKYPPTSTSSFVSPPPFFFFLSLRPKLHPPQLYFVLQARTLALAKAF